MPQNKSKRYNLDWQRKIPTLLNYVFDQKGTSACFAVNAIAAVEANFHITHGLNMRLSLQQLLDFCPNFDGINSGGYAYVCLDYMKDKGVTLEAEYPYTGLQTKNMKRNCKVFNNGVRVVSYRVLTRDQITEDAILKEVTKGPVIVTVFVNHIFQNFRGSHVHDGRSMSSKIEYPDKQWEHDYIKSYDDEESATTDSECFDDSQEEKYYAHDVLIVGFGTTWKKHTPYWIVRNSYGTKWGDDKSRMKLHRKNTSKFVQALAVDKTTLVSETTEMCKMGKPDRLLRGNHAPSRMGKGNKGNSLLRMLHVAAFAVSGYSSTEVRQSKPFNPLLGETYEAEYPEKGVRFFSEKVSHHPTIIACHCEGRGWKLWCDSNLKSKFWGTSIQLDPVGNLTLEFDDGEIFQWSKVTSSIYNLILGKPYCDHSGTMHIRGNRDYSCKLKFKEPSLLERNPHQVHGFVEDYTGVKVATLFGKWNGSMSFVKGEGNNKAKDASLLWERDMPPPNLTRYNLSSFAITLNELTPGLKEKLQPTDSRLRPDQRYLENGEYDKANSEKLRLETRQRMARVVPSMVASAPK